MGFDAALAAEQRLCASTNVRSDVYERLHRGAEALLPLNAFYVCLFEPRSQRLRFEYNRDDDVLDTPESFQLGDGPTSRVVRSGRSSIYDHRAAASPTTLPFGNPGQMTLAGMHLPLWESGVPGKMPIGVISAQSYRLSNYDRNHFKALRYLAVRASNLIRETQDETLREEERVIRAADERAAALKRAVAVILSSGLRTETRITLVARLEEAFREAPSIGVGRSLGSRELATVVLAAQGLTNGQIAERQMVAVETVKSQIKVSYRKLGFSSRIELGRALPELVRELSSRGA